MELEDFKIYSFIVIFYHDQEQNLKQWFYDNRCIMPASRPTELVSHISVTLLQGFANAAYKEPYQLLLFRLLFWTFFPER